MNTLRALRALLRVEWREQWRHPGRTWLVMLLVAVPVAALVGGSSLQRTMRPTAEERRCEQLGAADLRVELPAGFDQASVRALLPESARTAAMARGRADVTVPGRRLAARALAFDADALLPDGLAAGMLMLASGRAPRHEGEVALSTSLLRGLQRSVGGSVLVDGTAKSITGELVVPEDLSLPLVLRAADDPPEEPAHAWLVQLPHGSTPSVAEQLRASGLGVTERASIEGDDGFEALVMFVVGGFGMFEAALVVAAAFAVGLRRRQRELGLLGATGAPLAALRTSLLGSATTLAVPGALIGMLVGLATATALQPFSDGWNMRLNGPLDVEARDLLVALGLALLSATAAAVLPAWSATRLPIRLALRGRRPITTSSRGWLACGLVLCVGGAASVTWAMGADRATLAAVGILAGSIAGILGLGACSPWLLGVLARLAAPLPLPLRLAVRDAGRFRARHGPVVTAVLAGMSISVLIAALLASIEGLVGESLPSLRDDVLLIDGPEAEHVARSLLAELDAVATAPLAAASRHDDWLRAADELRDVAATAPWVACGGAELRTALGVDVDDAVADLVVLRSTQEPPRVGSRSTHTVLHAGVDALPALPFHELRVDQASRGPTVVLDPSALESLGLQIRPPPGHDLQPWILRLASPVDDDVLARAQRVAAQAVDTVVDAELLRRRPDTTLYRVVLLVCVLTGLVVVGVATALTALESAADAHVLHTLGAPPRVLRGHVAARAAYLALLGCVLAIPAGLLPAVGLVAMSHESVAMPFTLPWADMAAAIVALPALAFCGTWLWAGRSIRTHGAPRRAA